MRCIFIQNSRGNLFHLDKIGAEIYLINIIDVQPLHHLGGIDVQPFGTDQIDDLCRFAACDTFQWIGIFRAQSIFTGDTNIIISVAHVFSVFIQLITVNGNPLCRKSTGINCAAAHLRVWFQYRTHIEPSLFVRKLELGLPEGNTRSFGNLLIIGTADHDCPLAGGDDSVGRKVIVPGPTGDPVFSRKGNALIPRGFRADIPESRIIGRRCWGGQLHTQGCGQHEKR